jgi:hypothetical protein
LCNVSENKIELKIMTLVIIASFLMGLVFAFLIRLIVINRRERKGLYEVKYKPLSLSSKMKGIIRELIFKFSIQKFNRDFLLNLKSKGVLLMQIMHRSHFPEVCENISDVKFGLAIYIPTKPLSTEQKNKLKKVFQEEMEEFKRYDYPIGYFVIDAGPRVRFTGYLLAKIITEVFGKEDVDLELFDEGILPYHYSIEIAKGDFAKIVSR